MNREEGFKADNTYFRRAARMFYLIAVSAFTICLALNQPEYFRNFRWSLIVLDAFCVFFIFTALLRYVRNKTSCKFSSAIYVYTTLFNLSVSTWYYFYYDITFTGNFLFTTFLYCINLIVAGFCIGRKHTFIAALIYIVTLGPLIFISKDPFLNEKVFSILFLIIAFAAAVAVFLDVLERTHHEELNLKEAIFVKDRAIANEHNKRLQSEMESKRKEITTKTMFLLGYNENHNTLIRRLNSLKNNLHGNNYKQLSDILRNNPIDHSEKYWKEFESSFLEVNPEFYKKLFQICPDLSPSEIKLAALIHLGLSSKQIGNLNSNTPESVYVARSRLRNKLRLPTDVNLKTFLINFFCLKYNYLN